MKAHVKIAMDVVDGKRSIDWNNLPSHFVKEDELQDAVDEASSNLWKSDPASGARLGSKLFRFLNGSGGKLLSVLDEAYSKAEPLYLYIQLPFNLSGLPFELIKDEDFLLIKDQPKVFLIRRVSERGYLKRLEPQKRPLRVLFMACSPKELKPQEVLHFETEEERILSSVERFPLDLTVEDSGSLDGLSRSLYEGKCSGYEGENLDIVHLTGHAGIDYSLGPVFYMEDEVGGMDMVTPDRFWDAVKEFPPRLLFISGCSTGKVDKVGGAESFAFQMVEKGIPAVLGWGLPVSDLGATGMAGALYRHLSMGKGMCEAVSSSREQVRDAYYPWPLLRFFSDGSPLEPLVTPGQSFKPPARQIIYKRLHDSEVKVLEKGFIGRRREIQKAVRVLRGFAGEFKCGVLIHGTAGVGKSCVAGKLIERFPQKDLIVIRGKIGSAEVIRRLKASFERRGAISGLEILGSDRDFEERVKALFRSTLKQFPVLFYFDDFEKNLVRHGDAYEVDRNALPTVRAILYALDWPEVKASLIISSRYPFTLEYDGEDLAKKLEEVSLMSFRDADLEKKKASLPRIAGSIHSQLYLRFGGGNPRLLEMLEVIAREEEKYDIDELREKLEGKADDFIQEYLAEIIAKTEGADLHHFLHRAAVFRRPATWEAFAQFGDSGLLEKGVGLTLLEKEHAIGQQPLYWITPVIREKMWGKLDQGDQKRMHRVALDWYENELSGTEDPSLSNLQEALYHALESDDIRAACRHAIPLSDNLRKLILYKECAEVLQGVADRITAEVVERAEKAKDDVFGRFLSRLGSAWHDLDRGQKAKDYYEKALHLQKKIYGEDHPDVALIYHGIGVALRDLGDAREAMDYFDRALKIRLKAYGEQHLDVAQSFQSIGVAWWDIWKALDGLEKIINIELLEKSKKYYENALMIYRKIHGENQADVARCYSGIGIVIRGAPFGIFGDAQQALEFHYRALKIRKEIYGEKHPDIAESYNNIGAILADLGDLKEAEVYLEKALRLFEQIYEEDHHETLTARSNLDKLKKH